MADIRLLQVGSVGGVAVCADTLHLGHVAEVVIGNADYLAIRPPGWPTRPHNTGASGNTTEGSRFFQGNLGIDLLQQAHKTTFDFKAMTLMLQ